MLLTIVLLAFSLSLDALGVGLVYGLRQITIPFKSKLIICFFSIFYSGVSLLIGSKLADLFSPVIAKAIGLFILIAMGLWVILQALIKNADDSGPAVECAKPVDLTLFTIVIKSLGITIQVTRNPVEFDRDRSGSIDSAESLLLGFALSVDAIGVGIGSALVGFRTVFIPIAVGLCQWLMLCLGTFLGEHCTNYLKINVKLLSVLPGVLLICLAIIRLY